MGLPHRPIVDQGEAYEHPQTFRVFVEDEFRLAYDPTVFASLKEVIDDILDHIARLKKLSGNGRNALCLKEIVARQLVTMP